MRAAKVLNTKLLRCLLFGALVFNYIHGNSVLSKSTTVADPQLPSSSALKSVPKAAVNKQFIDSLRQAAAFHDYQVLARLATKKEDSWKDFGSASISFKQKQLFRAVINSSDYRNGSVVVKEPDGTIRGRGGGTLTFVKMTLQPDSRTIKLPTGYSLVESDFLSLYDALKSNMSNGSTAYASSAVNIGPFKDPVLVLVVNSGSGVDSPISEVVFLDPKSKLPLVWNTYKNGEPHAVVWFENLQPNKGLSDELFHL